MNKIKTIIAFSILSILLVGIGIWVYLDTNQNRGTDEPRIELYGEAHGIKAFYDVEFSAWKQRYEQEGMRDLFLELPYYTAEFLNLWMQAEDDEILNQIFSDTEGTDSHTTDYLDFFRKIKRECPETIFYGTDVGHQYDTTGVRYLTYLEENGQKDSEQYVLAQENIKQGQEWYQRQDPVDWDWREEKMITNFIRAYDAIGQKKIMGIYGSLHTNMTDAELMAGALKEHYGDVIRTTFVPNEIIYPESYQFGFSYVGLIFLMMLFIPNSIWTKHQPKDYEKYVKNENKVLVILEKIGQVLVTGIVLIFTDFNPKMIWVSGSGLYISARVWYLVIAVVLMVFYECYWVRYFRSEKTMKDFYTSFLGFPLAGATLPVIAFIFLGLSGNNMLLVGATVLLGIGHIGIHWEHAKEAKDLKNRR